MTLRNANTEGDRSWWGRPGGGREVLRVAAPLVVSSLSWTVMTFVDRMFLNWVSGTAMAAAFAGSIAWFAILCLPLGVCSYANTFVAQYDGARQPERIGLVVWQAVWIAVGFGALIVAAIPLAPPLFALADHGPEAYAYEVQYFQILCFGGPAMLIAQAGAAFYSGRGETWMVMIVDAAAALLNLVLDYCWIFGYYGFPEWGVAGAAWATVVASWVKAFVYIALPLQRKYRRRFGTYAGLRFDSELVRRIIYFGGPSGFQMLLDVMGFTTFILLVGRLGAIESEATSMAFSVSSLAFMPIYGLHLAASVLVGERLGENRDDLAARATYTTLQISWIYMLAISLLYVLVPGLFLRGFFPDGAAMAQDHAAVEAMAALLLQFVAAYNLLDATQMVFVGALKGAGDTRFLLRVSLVLAGLLAAFSYLSVEVWELNVFGCWTLVVIWCWLAAAIYVTRFRQGHWRRMRVIEQPAEVAEGLAAASD
ncbi:MAG: MATE family efflux transporter [Pirellulales bacterium]